MKIKRPIVYQVVNKVNGRKYIGSDMYDRPDYFGSPAGKNELIVDFEKYGKESFYKETLACVLQPEHITYVEMVIQKQYQVVESNDFYNMCYAREYWINLGYDSETSAAIGESLKNFYQTEEGKQKRQRLANRNKATKSAELKQAWADGKYSKRPMPVDSIREKLKDYWKDKDHPHASKIHFNGQVYVGWRKLKEQTGITKYKFLRHNMGVVEK